MELYFPSLSLPTAALLLEFRTQHAVSGEFLRLRLDPCGFSSSLFPSYESFLFLSTFYPLFLSHVMILLCFCLGDSFFLFGKMVFPHSPVRIFYKLKTEELGRGRFDRCKPAFIVFFLSIFFMISKFLFFSY